MKPFAPLPRMHAAVLALIFACALSGAARADDKANMEQTKIIGNRELPKVLYIVPWKKALPGDLNGRPLRSVLDEEMAPVDRDVFRRQVRYSGEVAPAAATAPATVPAAAPTPANGAGGK